MAIEKMNFQITQSHNKYDCSVSRRGNRIVVTRQVDMRIGCIIMAFGGHPNGFCSVGDVVKAVNFYYGANFNYHDIWHAMKRMKNEAGILTQNHLGIWRLSKKASKVWSKIEKNRRGA